MKRATLDEDRKSANRFVESLRESIDMKRKEETDKGGLVVIHACYGNLSKRKDFVGPTDKVSERLVRFRSFIFTFFFCSHLSRFVLIWL